MKPKKPKNQNKSKLFRKKRLRISNTQLADSPTSLSRLLQRRGTQAKLLWVGITSLSNETKIQHAQTLRPYFTQPRASTRTPPFEPGCCSSPGCCFSDGCCVPLLSHEKNPWLPRRRLVPGVKVAAVRHIVPTSYAIRIGGQEWLWMAPTLSPVRSSLEQT